MDKILMLSVAGSGKTTYIINNLSKDERFLIITYTDNNFYNIIEKIKRKYDGVVPNNINVMTYFNFIYHFCYRPLLADLIKAKGLTYDSNSNRYAKRRTINYYMNSKRQLYSNRVSLLLEDTNQIDCINGRLKRYYNYVIIDEIQDFAGRDFDFIEKICNSCVNFLFVGDFFQHTYSTSNDGNVNINLFDDYNLYKKRFEKCGFILDSKTLNNSWRCAPAICSFVSEKLGISISSNREEEGYKVQLITDETLISTLIKNNEIVKLHYQKASTYGINNFNWGETKGIDKFEDICVVLNKSTFKAYCDDSLNQLPKLTRNKLYVAITRAKKNVYLIEENKFKNIYNKINVNT